MEDKFEFTENGHSYTLNGKKLTGVTTVLSVVSKGDGLVQWSANEASDYIRKRVAYAIPGEDGGYWAVKPQDVEEAKKAWCSNRDSAGDKGKEVHYAIEGYINHLLQYHEGKSWEIENSHRHKLEQVNLFMSWAVENKIKFLESEKKVYSKTHWTAGTVDFVYEKNGEVYVGDVKTAKSIYPTNFWQTSAYKMMLEEMGLYKDIKGFTIVRLGKDGSFEVKENFAYDDNISGFLSALNIYRKLNAITPPKKVYTRKPKQLTK